MKAINGTTRFLVAEDDPRVGKLLARTLMQHGSAHVVATYKDARDALDQEGYAAIVADIGLPDGSGMDLVAAAKMRDPATPALIVSGEVDNGGLSSAFALGVHYLLKPVDVAEIEMFAARVTGRTADKRARIERLVQAWARDHELTESEEQVLRLAALGAQRHEIAPLRRVAPSTVKKQVNSLLAKTSQPSLDIAVTRLLRTALARS